MNDPRECSPEDPFADLSDKEENEDAVLEELEDLDRRKSDLLGRLKELKERQKRRDPNFDEVQIPGTPEEKNTNIFTSEQTILQNRDRKEEEVEEEEFSGERLPNPNELKVREREENLEKLPSNTTSYFMEKFQHVKKKEEIENVRNEKMLKARVHMFQGLNKSSKIHKIEYQPEAANEVEEYSMLRIQKRYIPKKELNDIFQNIKILRLNKLFAKVRPPKFEEPQYSNWVTLGIITQKGSIKFTSSDKPKKYFKFTISDFKYNVDIFIFDKHAVERYYNLRIGDIIAILNPEVLPWRPSNNKNGTGIKSFNLRINHNYHCIIEVGKSKDLGFCPIPNKINESGTCHTPIDISKEDRCSYHQEIRFRNNGSKRIELNGSFALGAPVKVGAQPQLYRNNNVPVRGVYHGNRFNVVKGSEIRKNESKLMEERRRRYFSSNNSAKAFFDEKFQNPDMLTNLDTKRRKIADDKRSNYLDQELSKAIENKSSNRLSGNKTKKEYAKMKSATETTLQTGVIQRLGFDPTHGKIAKVLQTGKDSGKDNVHNTHKVEKVKDLLEFKKGKVVLAPAKEELIKRKNRREEVWQKHFGSGKRLAEQPLNDDVDTSESDLEIV
ncbi:Mcm10p NDAI_0F00280 [Naumovozyma dairenensis CBS 421]|uniref:Uncharacterized protein n=1 Tax=Naumovozyma dairenensis (strain ATCC 10597 / BCRC 20456 / CBS 421 / NBRC 0211 / NRRL Y-12639) TaxID=1071378 RepID=G0WC36_NAUDC|nr:hypothetical protein NDAI_0F00280 [Naumovozyma dairenensis CBS 421]CCD25347.1 hypothetical protein NDAI_0F00280 [Naumovozyma dairenensis CBS 421]